MIVLNFQPALGISTKRASVWTRGAPLAPRTCTPSAGTSFDQCICDNGLKADSEGACQGLWNDSLFHSSVSCDCRNPMCCAVLVGATGFKLGDICAGAGASPLFLEMPSVVR
jgi:hypothetical protein